MSILNSGVAVDILDAMYSELTANRQVINRALEQVRAYQEQVMSWIEQSEQEEDN